MPPTTWRSVQLISIPDAAPPYDCETHGAACPAARGAVGSARELALAGPPGSTDGAGEPRLGRPGGAAAARRAWLRQHRARLRRRRAWLRRHRAWRAGRP